MNMFKIKLLFIMFVTAAITLGIAMFYFQKQALEATKAEMKSAV